MVIDHRLVQLKGEILYIYEYKLHTHAHACAYAHACTPSLAANKPGALGALVTGLRFGSQPCHSHILAMTLSNVPLSIKRAL